jgi:isochorismate synthase
MQAIDLRWSVQEGLQVALSMGASVAAYRLPEQSQYQAVVSFEPEMISPDLERIKSGFLIADFDFDGHSALFLASDWFFDGKSWHFNANTDFLTKSKPSAFHLKPAQTPENTDFVDLVERAVSILKAGELRKIVLSRCQTLPLGLGFDAWVAFEAAVNAYPTAFVSLTSTALYGTWIGASPEVLMSRDPNGIFKTVALAGTQLRNGLQDLSQALWRQKEIEEQALVSRYIINCLKKVRVREYEDYGPKTIAAGHLLHLLTDFEVDTQAIAYPQLPTIMLKLLHPTSAVCGMPKNEALAFIKQNEGYDRKLYSGFLGPTGAQTFLFVNLRCAQLHPDSATLYAGAGITADSKAQQELLETQNKMATIGKILNLDA